MIGPCLCKPDIMSQCIAIDYGEQTTCRCFSKSAFANKCMHRNEALNNHCWNPAAQALGLQPEEFADEDSDTEEYELVDPADLIEEEDSCVNCAKYACSYVIGENDAAMNTGGLNSNDLVGIGSNCQGYERSC